MAPVSSALSLGTFGLPVSGAPTQHGHLLSPFPPLTDGEKETAETWLRAHPEHVLDSSESRAEAK